MQFIFIPYILQVASRALRIPASKVHISETGTNLVPNASPTAASFSSDLYGMAVMVGQIAYVMPIFTQILLPLRFGPVMICFSEISVDVYLI